ncbi:MAG: ComEC/Rec2 family competence protein, partial [Paracoccaceae bacterium]
LTSLIAGLATAPIAAAHFNQIVHYGLIANILSVPVMGALVAPGAILSVSLMPFGVEIIGLWIVDIGLGWILKVATFFCQPRKCSIGYCHA